MKRALTGLALSALLVVVSQAQTKTWDGGASGSWNTCTNWDPDGVPGAGDSVLVVTGASVTDAPNTFGSLEVQSGATVTFVANLGGGKAINNSGTLNRAGVWRLGGSTIEMTATSRFGSGITFLDTGGATINFTDGAAFDNANMPFEHKGINTFGYKLSATGFTTLLAGWVRSGAPPALWADATYNIDISEYDLDNGATVTLADYSGSTMPALFDPTVNIEAGSSDLSATLDFEDTLHKLVLTITPPKGTVFIIK